jgi:hypothetical protein
LGGESQSWSDPARALTNRVVDLTVGYGAGRTKYDSSVALGLNLTDCGRASSIVVRNQKSSHKNEQSPQTRVVHTCIEPQRLTSSEERMGCS